MTLAEKWRIGRLVSIGCAFLSGANFSLAIEYRELAHAYFAVLLLGIAIGVRDVVGRNRAKP